MKSKRSKPHYCVKETWNPANCGFQLINSAGNWIPVGSLLIHYTRHLEYFSSYLYAKTYSGLFLTFLANLPGNGPDFNDYAKAIITSMIMRFEKLFQPYLIL